MNVLTIVGSFISGKIIMYKKDKIKMYINVQKYFVLRIKYFATFFGGERSNK